MFQIANKDPENNAFASVYSLYRICQATIVDRHCSMQYLVRKLQIQLSVRVTNYLTLLNKCTRTRRRRAAARTVGAIWRLRTKLLAEVRLCGTRRDRTLTTCDQPVMSGYRNVRDPRGQLVCCVYVQSDAFDSGHIHAMDNGLHNWCISVEVSSKDRPYGTRTWVVQ